MYATKPEEKALGYLGVLTKFTAAFGFGEEIGALAAWQSGKELDMVKENDEKSQYIAIVSHSIFFSQVDTEILTITSFLTCRH